MRHLALQIEFAEPAVGKVKLDLFAQTALVPDPVAVPDNQHSDHQFRIDRRPANVAVKRLQPLVQVSQRGSDKGVHPPQHVILRDHIIEIELVEQLPLLRSCRPIIPASSHRPSISRNQYSRRSSRPFSTASTHSRLWDGKLPDALLIRLSSCHRTRNDVVQALDVFPV
jgi:hypothetical protein